MKQWPQNKSDNNLLNNYPFPHLGIDEVGRGCLAGPVCSGIVFLNPEYKSLHYYDSKKIKESDRILLSEEIHANHYAAIGWASPEEVDELNIRQATFLAMRRAFQKFKSDHEMKLVNKFGLLIKNGTLLVDGRDNVPNIEILNQLNFIKGDQRIRSISAASLVAKVARDQVMKAYSVEFNQYGFEEHKGYGTEKHRSAIMQFGPTSIHRKSFGGVKEYIL